MAIQLRKNLAVITPDQAPGFSEWLQQHDGHVFRLRVIRGDAFFQGLGPEADARREPINITSRAPGALKLISNFAATPFTLDGLDYGSIESFWQGLKFPDESKRRELAPLSGAKAKDAGHHAPQADTILYAGETVRVGTWEHWRLMELATVAKFEQNPRACAALLATGERPLVHEVRPDSRTIPGVVLASIWMRLRAELQRRSS